MKTLHGSITDIEKVIEGGFCVGCGACAYVTGSKMKLNRFGEYEPQLDLLNLDQEKINQAEFVCPFLNETYNEKRLGEEFHETSSKYNNKLGFLQQIYGGHVKEEGYRENGTSGGFGTWIGAELLREGLIDGVIHVKEAHRTVPTDPFSKYQLSMSHEEILSSSRTKYHVIEFSEALEQVRAEPTKKFLFIGLPCMVKAVRRVQLVDPVIRNGVAFTAALVCGHLKSLNWSLSLAWGTGITPTEATAIKYRTKGEGIPARAYVFTAYKKNKEIIKDSAKVTGGKFNQGALMLNACNFCDDVVGETSDLTIGDAWLPRYEMDSNGNNLLIVRNKIIKDLLVKAIASKRVHLDELSEKEAVDAQAGGFRQRREGLSYRLAKYEKDNKWHPIKRVKPGEFIVPILRKIIYDKRFMVTAKSRVYFAEALEKGNYELYKKRMDSDLKRLRRLEVFTSLPRIIRKKATYYLLKLKGH